VKAVNRFAPPTARSERTVWRESKPPLKIIYTGHPPVLQQIANQVRSGSGMTLGRATSDGPAMPAVFTSNRIPVKEPRVGFVAALPPAADRLLTRLREIDRIGGALPSRRELYGEFGTQLLRLLQVIETAGHIGLWLAMPGEGSGIVLQVTGSANYLRTPGVPPHIRP
jgi:hypothetical protein